MQLLFLHQIIPTLYAAAIAAGGKDDEAPGLREHYHPNYYGAFIIGPDARKIEAVCPSLEA